MVIADDSGLVVPELNYEPGLRSARYASKKATDSANKKKLKEKIIEYGVDSLPAYFVCLLVIIKSTNDPMPLIFEGRAYGSVKTQSKGDNGFGYDDMFYPTGLDESFASIDNKLKAQLSHRGKAIKKMIDALKEA